MAESRSTAAAAPGAARPNEEEIARRAYHRWVQSGGVHGDDQRHWYDAEREMGPGSPARRD